ncbi:MAG: choice-of-anchor D domain-containing protein [Alphaproteobacteria bacterium]|nr:choice-of-anchor D domain-containing protein [Alphaproteobacteria bacterium]
MPAFARDAAFLNPGAMGAAEENAVRVDPKADIDVGDTPVNVAKRTSVFFVNATNMPVKIEKVTVNGDSNVSAEITANDCTKQGVIAPQSRCSVEVSATPISPGAWNVDLLMTHDGAGRIARAHLTGKTSGVGAGEAKSTGLAVSSKEAKPVNFGTVEVGNGKNVITTLMVNDSAEPITIYAIDVIEADNGLQKLDQGCAVDMELAPGASCPVTLLWVPKEAGPISTDLIIRHSGKLGFAVIPIRGIAKGAGSDSSTSAKALPSDSDKKGGVPMPPSATDLEKAMAGKVAPVDSSALGAGASSSGKEKSGGKSGGDGGTHLIGTVGDRALFFKPDGQTEIVPMGGTLEIEGKDVKLVAVGARSADVVIEGKKKTFYLEAVSSLVAKAADQAKEDEAEQQKNSSSVSIGGRKK